MPTTFRPRSNYALAGISFAMLLLFVANTFMIATSTTQIVVDLLIASFLGALAYLLWVKPKLVLGDSAIEVVNPLAKVSIPYTEVQELETKWALTIVHSRGRTTVWAAPASGKRRWVADQTFGWRGDRIPMSEARFTGSETMSESLNSISGQAAYLIREHMKRLH